MRPLDYDSLHKDGLYVRCMCGLPFTAHPLSEVVDPETREVLNPNRCKRYRPMIGKFGRSKNKPIQTYTEAFGHKYEYDEDGRAVCYWLDDMPALRDEFKSAHTKGDKYRPNRVHADFDANGKVVNIVTEAEYKFKTSHVHTIRRNVLNRIAAHGIRDFPNECCGFILGDEVTDVRPITNTNKYKGGSYTMDQLQQLAVLREVEQGKVLKVVYHSHPNMGAFFSNIDRDAASSIDPSQPDWPETVWIVMSIREPHRYGTRKKLTPHLADARAYLWNPAIKDFSEITLKVVE